MIKQVKSMFADVVNAITPDALRDTSVIAVPGPGAYDWKTQACRSEINRWGSSSSTNTSTCSGQANFTDDSNWDSISD